MDRKKRTKDPNTVFVSMRLTNAEAEVFLRYKKSQYLRNNAEAARKLMFERLEQVFSTNTNALSSPSVAA